MGQSPQQPSVAYDLDARTEQLTLCIYSHEIGSHFLYSLLSRYLKADVIVRDARNQMRQPGGHPCLVRRKLKFSCLI
jgi:hypothetical protein